MSERKGNLLVLQARFDPELLAAEQNSLRPMERHVNMHYVNALTDPDMSWDQPGRLLTPYDGVMLMGSGDIDLSQQTDDRDRYLDRVLPLAKKVVENDMLGYGKCLGDHAFVMAVDGEVGRHPEGKQETGTYTFRLTEAGKNHQYYKGSPEQQEVNYGHKDWTLKLPEDRDIVILGTTDEDPYSALQINTVWIEQQHRDIRGASKLQKRVEGGNKDTSLGAYIQTRPFKDTPNVLRPSVRFAKDVRRKAVSQ